MRKTNTLLCLENIKLIFLSIALKQTKAGPRSLGTPVLVLTFMTLVCCTYKITDVKNVSPMFLYFRIAKWAFDGFWI